MSTTLKSGSANQAAAQLAALIRATGCEPRLSEAEARQGGYYSVADFAGAAGISRVRAHELLASSLQSGVVERVKVGKAYFYRPSPDSPGGK